MIFLQDHEPAHVHAIGLGGEAKIEIGRKPEQVRTIWIKGLSKADASRAQREVVEGRDRFLRAWLEINGKST